MKMDNIIYIDFKNKKRIYPSIDEALVETIATPVVCGDRKTAFLDLMESGIVRTVINGAVDGVKLPEELAGQIANLNWSWKFDIPDLSISDHGISGTLSFQQVPCLVTIPWNSIISIWNLSNPLDSRVDWSSSEQ